MVSAQGGRGRRAAAGAALVALLILVMAVAGSVSTASASGVWLRSSSPDEAGDFWTPARVRRAVPLELKSDLAGTSAAAAELGSDFEQVADPTAPEFRVHGVILLSLGIFGYGRCSGTAVRSPNRSVVITAAHCLNSGWGDHWFPGPAAFVPAYRYGQRPFGVFPVRWMDTTRQWRVTGGSPNYDVGAMVVGRNGAGQLLGDAVGGAKIAWNRKPDQSFAVHGYPAEEPFDGETQRVCGAAEFFGHDPHSLGYPGPLNLAVSCGVTGGASGGGWLIHGDTLNGVTSYGYFDRESPDYGPYFGKEVARLFGRAARVR
jgi:V8-like Glu-specific endopeptidase